MAVVVSAIALSGCSVGAGEGGLFDNKPDPPQSSPANYRSEILAFMRTYLNNPVGVRDAQMADPVMRDVNGKSRYVSCLRYSARESDGSYREPGVRAIVFLTGRLDRLIERPGELCEGVAMKPFPELEKMTR